MKKRILLSAMLLADLGLSYAAFKEAFHSPASLRNRHYRVPKREQYQKFKPLTLKYIAELDTKPYEKVQVKSHDGLTLTGRYYKGKEDMPLAICVHGYKSTPLRDFCGGGRILEKLGFSLLLIDQRGQGNSDGDTMCFGIRERKDLNAWIDAFSDGRDVYLVGVSMGASTVLMAAPNMPPCVKGIIADSPYNSAKEIICCVAEEMGFPPKAAYFFIKQGANLFGGFDPEETTCAESVMETDIPILIIHGEADVFVPPYTSENIKGKTVRRITFEGADHGMSFMVDPERYERIVLDFIKTAK